MNITLGVPRIKEIINAYVLFAVASSLVEKESNALLGGLLLT
jgi:hypothetical protein